MIGWLSSASPSVNTPPPPPPQQPQQKQTLSKHSLPPLFTDSPHTEYKYLKDQPRLSNTTI